MSEHFDSFTAIRATYRLQFHREFTFRDATALVPYLAALGISHLYASPIMEARPGSTHGYDIIDHNRLNPEIGTEADFRSLIDALHTHGMGLILDFVPNHMGIGSDNAWWLDVLEWGQDSPYAAYFDINWDAVRPDLKGRVLLPVLGDHYGVILEQGEIALRFDNKEGSFSAWYYEHRFPISPRCYPIIIQAAGEPLAGLCREFAALGDCQAGSARERAAELKQWLAERAHEPASRKAIEAAMKEFTGEPGNPASFERLHELLEMQAYRIAYWRVAAEEINYRRFFNINELAGLSMELPELFEATHRLVFGLIEAGVVQGLRIDHIDGLFDPRAYCERLQSQSAAPLYVLVEKILARYEILPPWPIAGSTGYDFINQVLAIFVDPAGEVPLTRLYRRFTRSADSFDDVLYACKKRITQVNLASEMNVLAHEFHRLSMGSWRTRDFTLNGMLAALEEVIAAFPVYRTYVTREGASADDLRYIEWALAQAKKRWRVQDLSIFDFLQEVLTGRLADRQLDADAALRVAMRFQQVSGPVMAKAAEDTAFYRYFRLLALNEVGGDPRRFGMSVAAFHHTSQDRARSWPRAMVTTATHDTKRGEDARIRLALLSEMPREWGRRVAQWLRRGLHDQGGPRGKTALELEQPEHRLRGCSAAFRPDRARRLADEPVSHRVPCLCRNPGQARRDRFLGAAGAEADRAGGAGHLPGRRAVGFQPGRPRQPPAGGLGPEAGAARGDRRGLARRPLQAVAGRPRKALCCPTAARIAAQLSGAVRRRGLSAARNRGRGERAPLRFRPEPRRPHHRRRRAASGASVVPRRPGSRVGCDGNLASAAKSVAGRVHGPEVRGRRSDPGRRPLGRFPNLRPGRRCRWG